MEDQKFDRNEWQGKRRDQINFSEIMAMGAMLAALGVIVFCIASKIFL